MEPCIITKVGTLLTSRSISYNFMVADCQYSTATLSYKSLWYLREVRTLLQACRTTAHPMPPQCFCNSASLQHRLMSLSSICVVFLFSMQFCIQQQHGRLLPSKLVAFVSSCLHMALINTPLLHSFIGNTKLASLHSIYTMCTELQSPVPCSTITLIYPGFHTVCS